MSNLDVIRAWKDAEYRNSLSEAERAQLPLHPAGLIELSDVELDAAAGGRPKQTWTVWAPCCCDSIDLCATVTLAACTYCGCA